MPPAPLAPARTSRTPAPATATTQVARWPWESMFGGDLGEVRERDDPLASSLAQAVSDRAYSWEDEDEEWAPYQPSTSGGNRLLAHELAHVSQQGGYR